MIKCLSREGFSSYIYKNIAKPVCCQVDGWLNFQFRKLMLPEHDSGECA